MTRDYKSDILRIQMRGGEDVLLNTTRDTVVVASGIGTQLYFWLEKANLFLSVGVGVITFIYSLLRLYDYLKNRRNKNV